jgi:hypothetical protein
MVHNLERYENCKYLHTVPSRGPLHFLTLSKGPEKPIGTRSPLTPAVLVVIVGLKDADKIGHAGSIPIAGHSRNLSIGRGLAPLPKPH